MKNRTLLKTGLIGTVVAAVCCFTPVLAISLGALGLAAAVAPGTGSGLHYCIIVAVH